MRELYLSAAESLLVLLVRALLAIVPRLPERPLLLSCELLGRLSYTLAPASRAICLRNLRVVRPDLGGREARALTVRHLVHLYKNLLELLRTPRHVTAASHAGRIAVEGFAHLDGALAKGRGVLLLVPHFGNWELLGAAVSLMGYPLHSFYLDLRFRRLSDLLNEVRRMTGIRLIGRHELRKSVSALKANHVVGVLADQDGGEGGILARFFGRPVSFPAGPARLQRMTGAAVVPCVMFRRDDDTYLLKAYPELPMGKGNDKEVDEAGNARRMLAFYERVIRERPEQWLLLYDRFKERRHVRALLADEAGETAPGKA